MLQIDKDLDAFEDDLVRPHAFNVGYKSDSAGVPLETGIVQTLSTWT
jgi:hypothetical protein